MAGRKGTRRGNGRNSEETKGDYVISIEVPQELGLLLSGGAAGHLRDAVAEMLLALRSVIDHRLGMLEKKQVPGKRLRTLRIDVE